MNLGKIATFAIKRIVVPLVARKVKTGKLDKDAVKDVVGGLLEREVSKRVG